MLKNLLIKNFVLIEELEVNFSSGLNILTGETGAGKSMIIDAIDLVFGARASKDQIKTGTNKAILELSIQLSDAFPQELLDENSIELDEDNILIISREISVSGTRSRVNGVLVTQSYIQNIREYLIDIHSQNETYTYIQPKTHIKLLDNYGNKEHQKLLANFTKSFTDYRQTLKEYEISTSQIQSGEQKLDFLRFQINEIEEAQIEDTDEYIKLVEDREILINAEDLKELTYSGYVSLYGEDGSIIDALSNLQNKITKASSFDKNLSEIAEIVTSSTINLKDAADYLRDYSENIEISQQKLSTIEERIELLDKLMRKYGPDLSHVIDNLDKFRLELDTINLCSDNVDKLAIKLDQLSEKIDEDSQKLSLSRSNLAEILSALIQNELMKLEMPKAQFEVRVEGKEEITAKGIDNVEFMISTNPGEALKPLAKIASGGEISRIMLAIKTIFARADQVNTVIFDEIDTGISGKTSQVVAEELSDLGITHQVLCITHQPIIAAMSDSYLYIEKIQKDNYTNIMITKLSEEQKINAISKLASGSYEDHHSINFAIKLVEQSQNYKLLRTNNSIINV